MKKKLLMSIAIVVLTFAMLLAGCSGGGAKIPTDKPLNLDGYEVVFEDNFDGTTLDTTKWQQHPMENNVRRGAYYTIDDTNLFVKDGALTLRTNYQESGKYGEGWYTSFINSDPNPDKGFKGFASTYGYYEISCIAPPTKGIWSAFWMLPAGENDAFTDKDILNTAADGAEIDIMESPFYQGNQKGSSQHALHGDSFADPNKKTDASKIYSVPNMYTEYNKFGVLWTEDEYVFYINDQETWRTKHTAKGVTLGVAKVPQFMLLSVEVTGDDSTGKPIAQAGWSGDPDKNDKSKDYDFVIDYVKVYQLA